MSKATTIDILFSKTTKKRLIAHLSLDRSLLLASMQKRLRASGWGMDKKPYQKELKMNKVVLLMAMCLASISIFAYSLPLTLCEQVQEADYILRGRIESKETVHRGKANFVCTRYKLIVEKDLLGNYAEQELYFILAGGDDGDRKFRVSGVPMLEIGETSIFMLYKPEKKYFSLIVGSEQGRYTKFSDPSSGKQLVMDMSGKPMRDKNGEQVAFSSFEADLERDIPVFRNRPKTFFAPDPNANPNNLRESDFLRWDNSDKRGRVSLAVDPIETADFDQGPEIEHRSFSPFNGVLGTNPQTSEDRYVYNSYNYYWGSLPTVFNQLPSNYNILGLRDQAMMANWNKYVKTFKVRSNPTGTFGYPDFENDICGFVDNATYEDVFDETWGPTELAVCFYWGIDDMWEADIAVNPAYSWTSNNYVAYNSEVQPTDQTFLHELGHAWGAGHNFNDLSVMNYYQRQFRTYSVVYNSDADGIRYKYPNDINLSNLGVHGYYSVGEYQDFNPAVSDTVVTPGSNLRIRWFTVENTGLTDMPLRLDVFLTKYSRSWTSATYLTTVDMGTLSAESSNIINDIWVNVPLTVRPGYYHVALRVATGGDAVVYDNETWIHNLVRVTNPPIPGLWVGGTSSNWHRAANWSGNFIPDSNTDVVIPSGCLYNPMIVQSDGVCRNIIIDQGAALSIEYNSAFYGDLVNYGSILVGNPLVAPYVYVYGNVEIGDSGMLSFDTSPGILRVQGSWTEHPGSSVNMQPSGTLQFFGAGTSNLVLQSSNSHYQDLSFQKDVGTSVIFSSASISPAYIHGQLGIANGLSVLYQSPQDIYLYGNLSCPSDSYFEALAGTIHMLGMGGSIELSNTSNINSLNINSAGNVTLYSGIKLNGDLTISSGYLVAGYHSIFLKGSWFNNLGLDAFMEQTSTVVFNGDDDQNLYTETFYSLVVDKPGGRIMMRPGSTINTTNYTYYSGEVLLTGAIFNIADITNDGIYGTYRIESGEINLHQDAVGSIDLNANITMYDGALRIYGGSSSCWFAGGGNASLTMYGGTFDVVDQGIYINNTGYAFDNLIGGGTIRTSRSFVVGRPGFNPTNLIVELYGSTDAYVGTAEGSSLFHLVINKSGREGDQTRSNTIIGTERLAILGNLMISAGNFSAPQILFINGNWLNLMGPDAFIEGSGTVVFQGSEHQYCSTENFNNLRLAKVGGALRIQTAVVSCNSYEWLSGALDLIIGNFTALDLAQDGIYGDFYVNILSTLSLHQDSESWIDLNGTLNILGGECHIYGGNVISWWGYALPATVNMNGGLIYFHDQGIEIPNSCTLNITGGTIRTDGSFSLDKENFQGSNWTLELSGGNDAGLWVAGSSWLCNLTINKSSSRSENVIMRNRDGDEQNTRSNSVYANTNLNISGNVNISAGSFHAPELMIVQGNWTDTAGGGSFISESGTVTFSGFQTSNIFSSTGFYICNINKAADGIAIQMASGTSLSAHFLNIMDGLVATSSNNGINAGNVVISDGAGLNLSGDDIDFLLLGNFTNYNTVNNQTQGFYSGTSGLRIMGENDQYFTNQSPLELNRLWINCLSEASFRPNTQLVIHDLTIDSGGFASTSSLPHTITGDFVISNGRWYDHASTLHFTGSADQNVIITATLSNPDYAWFNNIVINKPSGSVNVTQSSLHLRNQGNLNIVSGTLDLNDQELFLTGVITVGSAATLKADAGAGVHLGSALEVLEGGRIELSGTSETPALVTHNQTGYPSFAIGSGGTIYAEYCIFEYLSGSGVNVLSGAIVDSDHAFNYCTFRNGAENGVLLSLNDSNGYTITGANFPANTWNSAFNVSKTAEEGEVFFSQVSGAFAGPAFEYDPNNRIQWNDFKADLIVTSAAWNPVSAEIGGPATLTATIKNTGVVASGPFYLDLIRNLGLAPEFGTTADNSLLVPSLAAGDSTVLSFENIVWGVAENWQSWLIADASAAVSEINENDNITGPYLISWITPPLPNIYISGLLWSQNPALIGGMVDLTVYITNSTSVAISEPIDIDLYFNPATPPDGSFAGDMAYTLLGGLGAEATTSHTFGGISSDQVSDWISYVMLNRSHSLVELDYGDNLESPGVFTWTSLPLVSGLQITHNPVDNMLNLSWNYGENVTGFNIYSSAEPEGDTWNYLGFSETHSFQTPASEPCLFFRIRAVNTPARNINK